MLSGNALKLLALVFMTLDHAGLMLFPTVRWLRIAGRLAMPIFAYMLAEGMRHTRSMRGYGTRMVTQGLICQLLFALAGSDWRFNIFFTFSLSILMVAAIRKAQQKKNLFCWALVLLSVAGSFALCELLPAYLPQLGFAADYGFFGALLPVMVYVADTRLTRLSGAALGLVLIASQYGGIQWYSLLALALLALYNGKRGAAWLKQFFYAYYPLHWALLTLLQQRL